MSGIGTTTDVSIYPVKKPVRRKHADHKLDWIQNRAIICPTREPLAQTWIHAPPAYEVSCVKVTIKLLNVYRKYLPDDAQGSAYTLRVARGTRFSELLAQIPVPMDERPVVLVNGSTPAAHQSLVDGDVVAVFPSIAGG